MLHEFIATHRDEIIRRCRAKVATRTIPPPTVMEIDHGVPLFLDQLVAALQDGRTGTAENRRGAVQHGHDLRRQGFSVSQVVHDYGDVCQSITDLARESAAPISTEDLRTLNQCLDDAIAGAVAEYGRERTRSAREGASASGTERLGFFAHELGNLINTGITAFEILKTGNVGVGGSTGAVLQRSLLGLRALVTRSLAEIRLTEGIQNHERFLVSGLIDDVATAAALEAETRGITLVVSAVDESAEITADRQILAAVVSNLLQNACKFTAPRTSVTLSAGASADRVFIEIADRCGGLPAGNVGDLFLPFEQRGIDRTGAGLGLAFCRWAVDGIGGTISARDLPGIGCVFTVDLPRLVSAARAAAR
jgi:signal transduction histidine kinase